MTSQSTFAVINPDQWDAYQERMEKINRAYWDSFFAAKKVYEEVCTKAATKWEEERQLAFAVFSQKPDSP